MLGRRRNAATVDDDRDVVVEHGPSLAKGPALIAGSLSVSERAVEKHSNSIFAKLGLSEEKDVNRRVKAVLVFLSRG